MASQEAPAQVSADEGGEWIGSHYGHYVSALALDIALEAGYPADDITRKAVALYLATMGPSDADKTGDEIAPGWTVTDEVYDQVSSAEDWMNEHVAPAGYYFGAHPWAGGWGLWEIDEDEDATL